MFIPFPSFLPLPFVYTNSLRSSLVHPQSNVARPSPVVFGVYLSVCLASLLAMYACYSRSSTSRPSQGPLVDYMRLAFFFIVLVTESAEIMDKDKQEETRYSHPSKVSEEQSAKCATTLRQSLPNTRYPALRS